MKHVNCLPWWAELKYPIGGLSSAHTLKQRMFIVPFICMPVRAQGLRQIWVFLERNGNHLIEIDTSTPEEAIQHAKEFTELNGFVLAEEPFCHENTVYCSISPNTPDLAHCYTWKETPPGTTPAREVWRPFLWAFSEEGVDPWGVNRLMESIGLSDHGHTAYSVLKDALKV